MHGRKLQIFQKILPLYIYASFYPCFSGYEKRNFLFLHLYTHHILGEILTLAVLNLFEVAICDLKGPLSLGRQRRPSLFIWNHCYCRLWGVLS